MRQPTLSPLERRIHQTRRRILLQGMLNRLVAFGAFALAAAVGWFLLQPLVVDRPPAWLRWSVLGGLAGLATLAAVVSSVRYAPNRVAAALSLDRRFDLRERVTTALSLSSPDLATPAGQALLADANHRAAQLDVRTGFPIRLGRRSLLIPALGGVLALLALFYEPNLSASNAGSAAADGKADGAAAASKEPAPVQGASRPPMRKPSERPNKSESLQKLEDELEKLYAQANQPDKKEKPEDLRAKVEDLGNAEEKLKAMMGQRAEKFERLQEQLQKLGGMEKSEASSDGPSRHFQEALARGDLAKAKEAVDELQKKVRDKKLDAEDAAKLKRELENMAEKLERLARNDEKRKKLQDLINQAKKDGRDAEALERELRRLEDEAKQFKELKDLAKKLGDCKECLDQKDFDGLAQKLGEMGKSLQGMMEEVEDLEDLDEHLQNLKDLRKRLCKKCNGQCESDEPDESDFAGGRGRAWGKRPENPDAASNFEEARQRGAFDPRGRKSYAGAVHGPAFTKKTSVEMAGEIQEAVQEAPEAVEVQKLPKAARDMVRDYFQKLGQQK